METESKRFFMKWGPISWLIFFLALLGPVLAEGSEGIGAGAMLALFWTLVRILLVGPNPSVENIPKDEGMFCNFEDHGPGCTCLECQTLYHDDPFKED